VNLEMLLPASTSFKWTADMAKCWNINNMLQSTRRNWVLCQICILHE
jgi:hypothetical protein